MSKYVLAIEFEKCNKEQSKYCLLKRSHKTCKEALLSCYYPMKENPICLCKKFDDCPRLYEIVEHDDRTYILYKCSGCDFFIKDLDGAIKTILPLFEDKRLYFVKDLESLLKKLKRKLINKNDIDLLIDFFESSFRVMNSRA